jgi:hypothetical protein
LEPNREKLLCVESKLFPSLVTLLALASHSVKNTMRSPEEELLTTEKNYVESLSYIVNSYLLPMSSWIQILKQQFQDHGPDDSLLCSYLMCTNRNDPCYHNRDICDKLFKNIQQILNFHLYLLTELEETKGNTVEIVKKISRFDRGLLFYHDYIQNADNARQLLNILKNDARYDFISFLPLLSSCFWLCLPYSSSSSVVFVPFSMPSN